MPAHGRALLSSPILFSVLASGCGPVASPPSAEPPPVKEASPAAPTPAEATPPSFGRATKEDVDKIAKEVAPFGGSAAAPTDDDVPAVVVEFKPNGPKEADVPELVRRLSATGAPLALKVTSQPDLSTAAYTQLLGIQNMFSIWAYSDNLFAALKDNNGSSRLERLTAGGPQLTDLSPVAKCAKLRFLEIRGPNITGEGLASLGGLAGLQGLTIAGRKVNAAGLAPLWNLTGLRSLFIEVGEVTDADLAPLARMTNLRSVVIGGPKVTKNAYEHLAGLPELRAVSILPGGRGYTDSSLVYLGRMQKIERIEISGEGITDAGLTHLRGMRGLKKLMLNGAPKAGVAGMRAIAELPNLEELWLDVGTEFTEDKFGNARFRTIPLPPPEAVAGLAGAKNLKRLHLGCAGDAYLTPVAKLPALEELDLVWHTLLDDRSGKVFETAGLTDAGLAHLRAATQLKKLNSSSARVTDAGLAHLSGLTRLTDLWLAPATQPPGVPTPTDAGVDSLLKMTALQRLDLTRWAITDAGAARLAELPDLRHLGLSQTRVTDGVIDALIKFPKLESVNLGGTKVSRAGVDRLKAAKPGLKVYGP